MTVYPRALWRIAVAAFISYLLIKTPEVAGPGWWIAGLFALTIVANWIEADR